MARPCDVLCFRLRLSSGIEEHAGMEIENTGSHHAVHTSGHRYTAIYNFKSQESQQRIWIIKDNGKKERTEQSI